MKVEVTTTTQTSNKLLGTEDKTLYYLLIGDKEKTIINIGLKSYERVKKQLETEKKS